MLERSRFSMRFCLPIVFACQFLIFTGSKLWSPADFEALKTTLHFWKCVKFCAKIVWISFFVYKKVWYCVKLLEEFCSLPPRPVEIIPCFHFKHLRLFPRKFVGFWLSSEQNTINFYLYIDLAFMHCAYFLYFWGDFSISTGLYSNNQFLINASLKLMLRSARMFYQMFVKVFKIKFN